MEGAKRPDVKRKIFLFREGKVRPNRPDLTGCRCAPPHRHDEYQFKVRKKDIKMHKIIENIKKKDTNKPNRSKFNTK